MAIVTYNSIGPNSSFGTAGEAGMPAGVGAAGGGFGGAVIQIPLTEMRASTGAVMTASAQANIFGISNTTGTSLGLISEAANNNTKTDTAIYELQVPYGFSGGNFTITANVLVTIGAGTLSTKTVACHCYLLANAGTSGADLVTTSATTFTANTAVDYPFAVTGATITPGARILVTVVCALTETSSNNVTCTLNSLRLS